MPRSASAARSSAAKQTIDGLWTPHPHCLDPQYGGQLLAYGRDALADEGAAAPIGFYSLILRPGVSPGRRSPP